MKKLLFILLLPFSILYGAITGLRNMCYRMGIFKTTSFDTPIISVGNLAVGGSGKTPMVEYIISLLEKEYTIAVLSRGYGRKTKGFYSVEPHMNPAETGDEPLQIKNKHPRITVAVCEDRVAGVQKILADNPNVNLILLDDAFQHRAIQPHVQLLLSTYHTPFYTDYMLPAGRLREYRLGASRASAIIFTKCPTDYTPLAWKDKPIFHSKIVYQNPIIEGNIVGFSGLADNGVFQNHLKKMYHLVDFINYKDHHQYTSTDVAYLLQKSHGATLVCTEKDWIKIQAHASATGSDIEAQKIQYVTITNTIEGNDSFDKWLKKQIT